MVPMATPDEGKTYQQTKLYLGDMREELRRIAYVENKTMSEVARNAIECYLMHHDIPREIDNEKSKKTIRRKAG